MSHQDWDPVVINKKITNNNVNKPTVPQQRMAGSKQLREVNDATSAGKLKELQGGDRQIMISMRVAKGLKQDELAQALAMPASIYKNIENGKTIPTPQQLNKINNYLKINLKLS